MTTNVGVRPSFFVASRTAWLDRPSQSASNSTCRLLDRQIAGVRAIQNPFGEIARPDEKLAERRPIGQEHAEFDNLRAVVKAQLDGAVAVG
jgi:hypothetical protein